MKTWASPLKITLKRRPLRLVMLLGLSLLLSCNFLSPSVTPTSMATPTLKWSFRTGGEVSASPVLVDNMLYCNSPAGKLLALDAATGQTQWEFKTGPLTWYFAATPALADNTLYVDGDKQLYAVDLATQQTQWQFSTPGYAAAPTYAQGLVLVGDTDGIVYALDAKAGQVQWQFKAGSRILTPPVVADQAVFVKTEQSRVYALALTTGQVLWQFNGTPRPHEFSDYSGVSSTADWVAFTDADQLHVLVAATGEEKWKFGVQLPPGGNVTASPLIANDTVYFGDEQEMYAFNVETGTRLWHIAAQVSATPALAGHTLFYGDKSGNLNAVEATTGLSLWRFKPDYPDEVFADGGSAAVSTQPLINGQMIYFGSRSQALYAIEVP